MSATTPENRTERLLSVDVLRGFNMFWLAGGTGLALGLLPFCGESIRARLLPQFEHAGWVGFTFYDLIFPLFIFVTGLSVVFSLDCVLQTGGLPGAYARIARRTLLLFALGVVYNGGVSSGWGDIRWMGVLQRIALCYGIASLLYCHLNPRNLIVMSVALLLAYALLLACVPVPGQAAVSWAKETHWAAWLDQHCLPGHKHEGSWDGNGLLGTLPATTNCLMGVWAARILRTQGLREIQKTVRLAAIGAGLCALALLASIEIPIIKLLWTPTYAMLAGGLSFLLLALIHGIVDVLQFRAWTTPFLWIGANALTIYLARNFMDFNALSVRLTGGGIAEAVGADAAYLLKVIVSLAFSLIFLRFLYQRKIFLRV